MYSRNNILLQLFFAMIINDLHKIVYFLFLRKRYDGIVTLYWELIFEIANDFKIK